MSHEIPKIAGAEAVTVAEGNMCGAGMRGADAPSGSKATSRANGLRRNLGDLIAPAVATAIPGHGRKPRRRSCRGSHEESDGCVVPLKPRTKPAGAGSGECGGKAAGRRKGERRRLPRALYRNRQVTEAASLRIGGIETHDHVLPPAGARCGKAARRDLCGGR